MNLLNTLQTLINNKEDYRDFLIATLELRALAIKKVVQDVFEKYLTPERLNSLCNEAYEIALLDVKITPPQAISDEEWDSSTNCFTESQNKLSTLFNGALNEISSKDDSKKVADILSDDFIVMLSKKIGSNIWEQLESTEELEHILGRQDSVIQALELILPTLDQQLPLHQREIVHRVVALLSSALLEIYNQPRKQQLITATQNYQASLIQIIQTELQNAMLVTAGNDDPSFRPLDSYKPTHMQVDFPPLEVSEILNPKSEVTQSRAAYFRAQNQNLDLAVEQYNALSTLIKTLQSPKPVVEQLSDFRDTFMHCRKTIEKRNDSTAITFLKIVATVFSLGLAVAFGIWKPSGKHVSERIENIVSDQDQIFSDRTLS